MVVTGRYGDDRPAARASVGQPGIGRRGHGVEVDAGRADHDHRLIVTVDAGRRGGYRLAQITPSHEGRGGRQEDGAHQVGMGDHHGAQPALGPERVGQVGLSPVGPQPAHRLHGLLERHLHRPVGEQQALRHPVVAAHTDLQADRSVVGDHSGHLEAEHLADQHAPLDDRVGAVASQEIGEGGRFVRQWRGRGKGRRLDRRDLAVVHPPHVHRRGECGRPPGHETSGLVGSVEQQVKLRGPVAPRPGQGLAEHPVVGLLDHDPRRVGCGVRPAWPRRGSCRGRRPDAQCCLDEGAELHLEQGRSALLTSERHRMPFGAAQLLAVLARRP